MSRPVDSNKRFIEQWIWANEAEAPILLTGFNGEELEIIAEEVAGSDDIEVIRLSWEKPTISIEELREIFFSVARTTLRKRRLVVLPAADRLSLPAANALLKALEESAKTTRWLLTSTNPGRLLPTIRSRCQQVRISTVYSAAVAGDEIEQIVISLSEQLRKKGPSAELKLAFMRLRDYYCIKSLKGNEKLAKEVLFASLPDNIT